MGNASMWAIPRSQVSALAEMCQNNMMFMLHKSFYLNASWAQSWAYKIMSPFLHKETIEKIQMSSDQTHDDLKNMVHPCQLEKRFGGTAETPTNFWPPYVGQEFIPDTQKVAQSEFKVNEEEYKALLQ